MERLAETTLWLVDVNRHRLGLDFLNHRRAALPVPLLPIVRPDGGEFVYVRPGVGAVGGEDDGKDERSKRQVARGRKLVALDGSEGPVVERQAICIDCGQLFTYPGLARWRTPRRFCVPCKRRRERESNCRSNENRRLRGRR